MVKKKTPPSINKVVLLLLAVLIISSVVTFALLSLFDSSKPDEVHELYYTFAVNDRVSFNLDADALHFGGGLPGSRLHRSINISAENPAQVRISWLGQGQLSASENDFFLERGENRMIDFFITIPQNASFGEYGGKVLFSFYR